MCRLDPVHERSLRDILSPSICGLVVLQLCIFKYILLFAQNAQLPSLSIRNLSNFSVSSARATVEYPTGHLGVSLALVCQPPWSTCSAFSLILTKSFVLLLFLDISYLLFNCKCLRAMTVYSRLCILPTTLTSVVGSYMQLWYKIK